jgi:hypothetical protein
MIRQTPPIDPHVPRIFLDSSVILAGASSVTGASHALLALGELALLTLITKRLIFNEVENNIAKKL